MGFSLNTPPYPPNIHGVDADVVHTHRESDENYEKVVLMFNDRWRLIVCQHDIQWIVQRRESLHGGAWRGVRYVTRLKLLIEVCGELGLPLSKRTRATQLNKQRENENNLKK